jgi:aerobic carbon-monoxide dehydrogenase medium subunit
MKPAPFTYHAPTSLADAVTVLAEVGTEGKVLAGGQSLLPVLSMRLAAPAHLVDINRVSELAFVRVEHGGVRVGALARHAELERDLGARTEIPLLGQGLRLVAHPVIRNRGTTVGSIVHADPAGEMTAVLALLGGTVELASAHRTRTAAAVDFFLGPLESDVRPGELVTSVFFPAPPVGTGTAFVEVSRRHGDYAICGVAAAVRLSADRAVVSARAAYLSVGPVPVVLDLTEAVAGGQTGGEAGLAVWAAAGELAAGQVDPEADIHASAAYRRHLVGVLTARGLAQAARAA